VSDPLSGDVKVALFAAGQAKGANLGSCGTLQQSPQASVINGVQNQRGVATFDCLVDGHTATGDISFAYCH
jgi:hypothetical protein